MIGIIDTRSDPHAASSLASQQVVIAEILIEASEIKVVSSQLHYDANNFILCQLFVFCDYFSLGANTILSVEIVEKEWTSIKAADKMLH